MKKWKTVEAVGEEDMGICLVCGAAFRPAMEDEFKQHWKDYHAREDMNQAAARVVRESTEKL